uniref:Secretin receptor n=1 Tax=Amphilophus citrinellus TaxID=61819 RepID=A0A3Q0STU2_AMPCI
YIYIYINLFILFHFFKQANSSPVCHPNVRLVKEEEKCMKDLRLLTSHKTAENNSVHCGGMWDHLNCWPPAFLGETVSQPCPEFFNSGGKVHRNCTASGWTDLLIPHEDACETHLYFSYVKTMYTVGYTVSLISLSIAITIFCLFRKLHCTRNYIHIQLFISFILRAIFIFIRDALLFTNEEIYHCDYYPAPCKFVLMFSNYSILANYSWLLVEGHFLFTLSHRPKPFFPNSRWLYHLQHGRQPSSKVYMTSRKKPQEGLQTQKEKQPIALLLSFQMTLIFFMGILRILVSKLRMPDAQRNELSQYKRLIKSTFFLVALFGLHYILFMFLPVKVSSSMFRIWTFVELALSSTQGFVVAVLYCFMNGEVQHEFQRRWRRWRLTQHLPTRRRQYHSSISHSGAPHTQVSLLPGAPGSLTTSGLPTDTVEM